MKKLQQSFLLLVFVVFTPRYATTSGVHPVDCVPVYIWSVVDVSDSVTAYVPSAIDYIEELIGFLRDQGYSNIHVGAQAFADKTYVISGLSADIDSVQSRINRENLAGFKGVISSRSTHIFQALKLVLDLQDLTNRPDGLVLILLFSDGCQALSYQDIEATEKFVLGRAEGIKNNFEKKAFNVIGIEMGLSESDIPPVFAADDINRPTPNPESCRNILKALSHVYEGPVTRGLSPEMKKFIKSYQCGR